MKTDTFTPGPWRFDGHGINGADGTRIAKVSNTEPYTYPKGLPQRCAEFDATSNLIAAAPELLAALQDLMQSCYNWAPTIDRSRAKTAIAKATRG